MDLGLCCTHMLYIYYICKLLHVYICVFHMWYPFILSVNIHDIIFHGWIKFQCLTKPHSILPIVYCQAFGSFTKSCYYKQSCRELPQTLAVSFWSSFTGGWKRTVGYLLKWASTPNSPPCPHPWWYSVLWSPAGRTHSQDLRFKRVCPTPRRSVWTFQNPHN